MSGTSDSHTSPTLLGRLRQVPIDQRAWDQFLRNYGPKIELWCRRWGLQDADAQDVVQMVLLKLSTRMSEFEYDPSRSFRGWLRTICRHALSDLVGSRRNQAGSGDSSIDTLLNSLPARDELIQQLEETYDLELSTEAMQRVRLRVQPQTWEAFRLTAIEGLSGAEVASRLGIKITLVYKARSSIQKLLQEEIRYLEGPSGHD